MKFSTHFAKYFFIAFILINSSIFAQQHSLSGRFITEEKQPVDFVNVSLFQNDTTILEHTVSDSLGRFSFSVAPGTYTLICKYVGLEVAKQIVNIEKDTHLADIVINTTTELGDVTVTAVKPLIERKIDRLVFNVEQSIQATGGTAVDVLKATPLILVENDKISIVGKSNVKVMINERLLPFPTADVLGFLQQISSDQIAHVEVITTPPAQYDAEGNSGLINIVLKNNLKDGMFGNIRSTWKHASKLLTNNSVGFNYRKKQLSIDANVFLYHGNSTSNQKYKVFYPNRLWDETSDHVFLSNSYNGSFSAEYRIHPRTTFGVNYYYLTSNHETTTSKGRAFIYNNLGILDSSVNYLLKSNNNIKWNIASAYTTVRFDENYIKGKKMDINVDYINRNSNIPSDLSNISYFDNGVAKPGGHFVFETKNDQSVDILTAKVDFDLPTNFFDFSTGVKSSFIETNADFKFYDRSSGTSILDLTKTNKFRYSERIYAAYATIDMWLSQNLEIKVGARAEQTQTIGFSPTTNARHTKDFFKLFPTAFVNYMFSDNTTLDLSYSQRVDRPAYSWVNPFKYYTTSYNYQQGNPDLKPYYSDNLELSFMHKEAYTQFFVSFLKNGIDQIDFVDSTTNIQRLTAVNIYDQTMYGLYQQYTFALFDKKLSNTSYVVAYYSKTNSLQKNTIPDIGSWGAQFSTTFTYIIDKKDRFSAELAYRYFTPSAAGSYKASEWSDVNVSLKAKLLANKNLIVTLNGNDIFKTSGATFQQNVNGIRQDKYSYRDNRYARITLTYNFGEKITIEEREDVSKEERSRIQ